jgi:hypothetical protein
MYIRFHIHNAIFQFQGSQLNCFIRNCENFVLNSAVLVQKLLSKLYRLFLKLDYFGVFRKKILNPTDFNVLDVLLLILLNWQTSSCVRVAQNLFCVGGRCVRGFTLLDRHHI